MKYEAATSEAPEVVASGRGRLAEQIIALAKAHGVFIKQDPDLVEALAKLDIGDVIPPELYAVVAEVLIFVYRVNARKRIPDGPTESSRSAAF